jgi:hypothetical protein
MAAASANSALLPPKFNGTDGNDVRKWLRSFQEFADDCEWDDVRGARKLKLLLCGEAQMFVWDLDETKQKSLKSIKEALIKQYGGSADSFQAMTAFEERKRQPGETLRELCFALRQLHQKARPDDNAVLRDRDVRFRLLQLLAPQIREQLLKSDDYNTCTLDVLQERALRLEQVTSKQLQASEPRAATVTDANDRLQRLEQRMEDLIARVQAHGKQTASGRGIQRRRRGCCYNCGKPGHFAAQCRAADTRQPIICRRCSGRGHTASVCPSKSENY